jgi:hypothetical protein
MGLLMLQACCPAAGHIHITTHLMPLVLVVSWTCTDANTNIREIAIAAGTPRQAPAGAANAVHDEERHVTN